MPIFYKSDENFPKSETVIVNGKSYTPDYVIDLPLNDNDEVNINNCICIFSVRNFNNPLFRKHVGAKSFEKLDNNNILEKINGYLPEYVFCFQETKFPLNDFIKEQDFKYFGEV